jgi:hypothetical protein
MRSRQHVRDHGRKHRAGSPHDHIPARPQHFPCRVPRLIVGPAPLGSHATQTGALCYRFATYSPTGDRK